MFTKLKLLLDFCHFEGSNFRFNYEQFRTTVKAVRNGSIFKPSRTLGSDKLTRPSMSIEEALEKIKSAQSPEELKEIVDGNPIPIECFEDVRKRWNSLCLLFPIQ